MRWRGGVARVRSRWFLLCVPCPAVSAASAHVRLCWGCFPGQFPPLGPQQTLSHTKGSGGASLPRADEGAGLRPCTSPLPRA